MFKEKNAYTNWIFFNNLYVCLFFMTLFNLFFVLFYFYIDIDLLKLVEKRLTQEFMEVVL